MFNNQITIGPEFFAKAFNDYSDRYWAWAREIIQNSIDAPGCSKIWIDIARRDDIDAVVVSVVNNGKPMDMSTLVNKLLALGGSGKAGDANAVGGFGKAKEILYFCHRSFAIHSGGIQVSGAGAGYDLSMTPFAIHGTRSDVEWAGSGSGQDNHGRLVRAFEKFIGRTQWWGAFVLNGQDMKGDLWKGRRRREFEWGTVFTTNDLHNECVVRMKGVPMFTRYSQTRQGVIVELTGNSLERLTSSRDGLSYPHSRELDNFITELSVDTRSALKASEPTYTHIQGGRKLNHRLEAADKPIEAMTTAEIMHEIDEACHKNHALKAVVQVIVENRTAAIALPAEEPGRGRVEFEGKHEAVEPAKSGRLAFDFLLKNSTSRDIPKAFDPASAKFSKHSSRLVKWWAACLLALHEVCEHEAEFTVGFIFDEERGAEFDGGGSYGKVYLINPCHVTTGPWKARYTKAGQKHDVLSLAIHEFVHGLGHSYHNEEYAAALTFTTAVVLANMKRFARCFR